MLSGVFRRIPASWPRAPAWMCYRDYLGGEHTTSRLPLAAPSRARSKRTARSFRRPPPAADTTPPHVRSARTRSAATGRTPTADLGSTAGSHQANDLSEIRTSMNRSAGTRLRSRTDLNECGYPYGNLRQKVADAHLMIRRCGLRPGRRRGGYLRSAHRIRSRRKRG